MAMLISFSIFQQPNIGNNVSYPSINCPPIPPLPTVYTVLQGCKCQNSVSVSYNDITMKGYAVNTPLIYTHYTTDSVS